MRCNSFAILVWRGRGGQKFWCFVAFQTLKVSVFLFVSSLCFARHHHLAVGVRSSGENFLVPPNVLLSLLLLLRHHLQPLAVNELDPGLKTCIQQLQLFTQEAIWRIFISLKDCKSNMSCCADVSFQDFEGNNLINK